MTSIITACVSCVMEESANCVRLTGLSVSTQLLKVKDRLKLGLFLEGDV